MKSFIPGKNVLSAAVLSVLMFSGFQSVIAGVVGGEQKTWHRVSVTFDGPDAQETGGAVNPFTGYRLDVTFTHAVSGKSYTIPGHYAADTNAAHSHATSGNKWRVYFAPDEVGEWRYTASFRTGTDVVYGAPGGGTATSFDGDTDVFTVAATDKTGQDFRGKGRLKYVGHYYLQHAGNGEYFIKGGSDSPENFLGYYGFDGTYNQGSTVGNIPNLGADQLHNYDPHLNDWNEGDPNWTDEDGDDGKRIIGAVNYLASVEINSLYFLPQNLYGDGYDVWPYVDHNARYNYDVSKLDQWEIVFSHMEKKGIMLHFVLSESENNEVLGTFYNNNTKPLELYYRELVSRFGHHNAITWNLGEEFQRGTQEALNRAALLHGLDPYDGLHLVVHPGWDAVDAVYGPLLGNEYISGMSIQLPNWDDAPGTIDKYYAASANANHKWVCVVDEIANGVQKDESNPEHNHEREVVLWGTLMNGSAGTEWYTGWTSYTDSWDNALEDFRKFDILWKMTGYARKLFVDHLPFWDMVPSDNLVDNGQCFAKPGAAYLVYLRNGGTDNLDLGTEAKTYTVQWLDPRNGGLSAGSVTEVTGPGNVSLGNPPNNATSDWAVMIKDPQLTSVSPKQLTPALGGDGFKMNGKNIEFALTSPQSLKIDLVQVDGGQAATIAQGSFGPGNHSVNFDGQKLSSGLYLLRFKSDSQTLTRIFLIN